MSLQYIKDISDIVKFTNIIPRQAIEDVRTRLGDYALSMGKVDDGYLNQQLRYLDHIVQAIKNKEDL